MSWVAGSAVCHEDRAEGLTYFWSVFSIYRVYSILERNAVDLQRKRGERRDGQRAPVLDLLVSLR